MVAGFFSLCHVLRPRALQQAIGSPMRGTRSRDTHCYVRVDQEIVDSSPYRHGPQNMPDQAHPFPTHPRQRNRLPNAYWRVSGRPYRSTRGMGATRRLGPLGAFFTLLGDLRVKNRLGRRVFFIVLCSETESFSTRYRKSNERHAFRRYTLLCASGPRNRRFQPV